MQEIVKSIQGLLVLLEKPHSATAKVKIIDEQIETLESAVRLISSNWIPKKERLKRALLKQEEIKAEIRYYER